MTSNTTTYAPGVPRERTARRDLRAAIRRRVAEWHRRHVIARTAAALASLDDVTLRDIGISRDQVYTAAVAAYEESARTTLDA